MAGAINISSLRRKRGVETLQIGNRPALCLVRNQAAAAAGGLCALAAQAVVAAGADSAGAFTGDRRRIQLPAYPWPVDAAARPAADRAGRAVPATAAGRNARMDRAQMDGAPARQRCALSLFRVIRLAIESFWRLAALHDVTQLPSLQRNQGLRHNYPEI